MQADGVYAAKQTAFYCPETRAYHHMKQTRLESLCEGVISTLIGYVVAMISQLLIFNYKGIHISAQDHLEIVTYFTVISLARGYVVRRWFNAGLHKAVVVWVRSWYTRA